MPLRNLIIAASLAALLLSTGCQIWQPGGTQFKSADGVVQLHVPAGWMYSTAKVLTSGDLLATKDGVLLQRIVIEHHDLAKPLPNSKRTIAASATPYELAEEVAADLHANHELQGLTVEENTPMEVGGKPGFRLIVAYQVAEPTGLRLMEAHYGALVGARLYSITYTAPARHYFDRDLAEFDVTVKSVQFSAQK